MSEQWIGEKAMSTGIYDLVERFGSAMTSPEAKAASDKNLFRQQAWVDGLSAVTDERLRRILEDSGLPQASRQPNDLKDLVDRVLPEFGTSEELPHILVALSMAHLGVNPNAFREYRMLFGL